MSTTPVAPALASHAIGLGAEPTYLDADGRRREVSAAALEAVCALIGARGSVGATAPVEPVVLVRGTRIRSGLANSFEAPLRVQVVLEDGTELAPVVAGGPADLERWVATAGLPVGLHDLCWEQRSGRVGQATLVVAPDRFPLPDRTRPGLGLFAPVHALWSEDEPMPAYSNIGRLGAVAADVGVEHLVTLPVHAQGLGDAFDPGPYSPVSRFHLNELLVDDRRLGSAAPTLRGTTLEWDRVLATRSAQLRAVASELRDDDAEALTSFLRSRPDVTDYARFCAPDDPARVRVHEVGQWLAHGCLDALVEELGARGQQLAMDLPVGSRRDGWETATWPELFIAGASIGAPPDTFFAEGQDWGLPPVNPVASRRAGHRVWRDLLANACRHAGVLRIDHVMQVHRLWWVPEGHHADDGVYVHYPADELLGVAAVVAQQTGTTMVGEDLGTVPREVGLLLADWGLPGMYEEGFTLHELAGSAADDPMELPVVPAGSWAGIRTHDMAPLAATADDLDLDEYRTALATELGHGLGRTTEDLAAGIVERLRASSAFEVVIDLDDVLGVEVPHNVPGTVGGNWSRRIEAPVEHLRDDPRLRRVLSPDPPTTTRATSDPRPDDGPR